MTPAERTGRLIACGVAVASIIGAVVDSSYWLIWGGLIAWAFWS